MSKMKIDEYGNKVWRNKDGQIHREDGPAIIYYSTGLQEWLLNGRHHRDDGPAAIYPDRQKKWLVNGLLHRFDGPAVIWDDSTHLWYVNGHEVNNQANAWIKENNFPHWDLWSDAQKLMFQLAFSGT